MELTKIAAAQDTQAAEAIRMNNDRPEWVNIRTAEWGEDVKDVIAWDEEKMQILVMAEGTVTGGGFDEFGCPVQPTVSCALFVMEW